MMSVFKTDRGNLWLEADGVGCKTPALFFVLSLSHVVSRVRFGT